MKIESVSNSYKRWAPVYDSTFGAVTNAGRTLATNLGMKVHAYREEGAQRSLCYAPLNLFLLTPLSEALSAPPKCV